MDVRSIGRQGRRVRVAAARLENRLTRQSIQLAFEKREMQDMRLVRPDGTVLHALHILAVVDAQRVQGELVRPLTSTSGPIMQVLPQAVRVRTRDMAVDQMAAGGVLIFAQGAVYTLILRAQSNRAIDTPTTERAVFGPKDSLIETLDQNVALIRGHLRDPRLRVHRMVMGTMAPKTVAVLYVNGVAEPSMVDLALKRLESHRPRRVGFVTSLLRPLFGQIWTTFLPADFTERPYRIADFLFRGRIAILVDGSPYAMITPVTFEELFMDEEEFLQATSTRYFVRALRVLAFFIAMMIPGLYVAILTVNTTIMPGLLAIAVSSNRQALAYPIVIETFFMLLVLDIMAEATVSMKGVLGPAISIVGSLIVGQAAVRANLASNLGVILLALTALATFITPRYQLTYAVRVQKYPILFVSGMFGIVGWSVSLIWFLIYNVGNRSLGVPFMEPLAPLNPSAMTTVSPSGPKAAKSGPKHPKAGPS